MMRTLGDRRVYVRLEILGSLYGTLEVHESSLFTQEGSTTQASEREVSLRETSYPMQKGDPRARDPGE
jgi:hypothetical protein